MIPRLVSKIRRPIKWRKILLIAIIILIILGIFYALTEMPSEQMELTEEQKEIDNFLSRYYDALRSRSISKISEFFTENAVIISSDGTTYRGNEMIKRYYDEKMRNLDRYEVKAEVSEIEIRDRTAEHCVYLGNRAYNTVDDIDTASPIPAENIIIRGNVWYADDCIDFFSYNGHVEDLGSGTGMLIEKNVFGRHGGRGALNLLQGINDTIIKNNVFLSGGGGQIRMGWYNETWPYASPCYGGNYCGIRKFDWDNIQIFNNSFHIENQDANDNQYWQ